MDGFSLRVCVVLEQRLRMLPAIQSSNFDLADRSAEVDGDDVGEAAAGAVPVDGSFLQKFRQCGACIAK